MLADSGALPRNVQDPQRLRSVPVFNNLHLENSFEDKGVGGQQVLDLSVTTFKWCLHSNKQGSNTVALRNRSDFKQALSTLQRLQREAREEPLVPVYSYKHKQWQLAQSSSSTWWSWQGSWWSSYNSESQEGGEPSIE